MPQRMHAICALRPGAYEGRFPDGVVERSAPRRPAVLVDDHGLRGVWPSRRRRSVGAAPLTATSVLPVSPRSVMSLTSPLASWSQVRVYTSRRKLRAISLPRVRTPAKAVSAAAGKRVSASANSHETARLTAQRCVLVLIPFQSLVDVVNAVV